MDWIYKAIPQPDTQARQQALHRQSLLTKPAGSLGLLEAVAVRLASMQGRDRPSIEQIWVSVFAADHGVAAESVSAFPQAVTLAMVKNFIDGGAAVNVLSRCVGAALEIVDVGLASEPNCAGLISARAGSGTANFSKQAAMSEAQLERAVQAGKEAVIRAVQHHADLFIGGEMGIANTTSASAVACALLNLSTTELTGAGTGLKKAQIEHKTRIVQAALHKHRSRLVSPVKILQFLGGFEIAALVGAYIHAGQLRLPVLVDGFIATVAAVAAVKLNPGVKEWLFFAHCSNEKGHRRLLQILRVTPLLDLSMRLGEGSGALAAVPVMLMACRLHNEMATFEDARVPNR